MRVISEEYDEFLEHFVNWRQLPEAARILKIGEEYGEACDAFLRFTTWNIRKPPVSIDEVVNELADVAMTTLIAIRGLGDSPDLALRAQMEKTLIRMKEIDDLDE